MDCTLPGFSVHGILQARTLQWVAISFSNAWKWKVKSLSRVQPSVTPWTAAYQTPASMGFSRQQYWSGILLMSFNFTAAKTIHSDFGAEKIKFVTVSIVSPSICYEVMGPDIMIFIFWMLRFKPDFFTLLFLPHQEATYSSSSFSTIRVVSFAHLRLLIFLLAILIPACASSSPAFLTMYSAYKLNKQGDNIQPWCTPFPVWNKSVVPCPVLTVASWPAYRFLKRQVRWSGIPTSLRIFHSLLWSTQRF